MKGELPPDVPPRTVKPRTPKYTHRNIVAVTDSHVLVERTGTLLASDQLPHVLASEPSSIIVCQGFGVHLERLITTFGTDATFQYRVTPRYRDARNNDGEIHPTRVYDAVTNFVGFRRAEKPTYKSGKRWTRYHYPIDPVHFIRDSIDSIYPDDSDRIQKLCRFAREVREFCANNLLEVKPSAGGLAAQLLRDSRFYPESRRKMPSMLNNYARPQLPGNYYHLRAEETPARYEASYLDISNAHHEMAQQIQFPCVNSLHAYGRWAETRGTIQPFVSLRTRQFHGLLSKPGLFHVGISVPHLPSGSFPPPCLRIAGKRNVWLYSNELELVEEFGGTIDAIYAAIISDDCEHGLNRYAKWALAQITAYPHYKPWLKPTLHATYGVLAARAVPFETGYYRAEGRLERTEYPMGKVSIPALARKSQKPIESQIVNVIHRGMIEAEVRCQVLRFARQMQADGYNVLAVYADSLFVEGAQMPFLPHPWRTSAYCTNLRFYGPTHFISDQEARLPGIARNTGEAKLRNSLIRRELLLASLRSKQPQKEGQRASVT